MCDCEATYALKNKRRHANVCPNVLVECEYCHRGLDRKNLVKHRQPCSDYLEKKRKNAQLTIDNLSRTIAKLSLKLNSTERNYDTQRVISMQTQRALEEMTKKNEFHEDQIRKIEAGWKFRFKLYILCFTIGLLFCLAFQKSIEDFTITPSFVTYAWIITYFLIGLCLSFFVFLIAVAMISDEEED